MSQLQTLPAITSNESSSETKSREIDNVISRDFLRNTDNKNINVNDLVQKDNFDTRLFEVNESPNIIGNLRIEASSSEVQIGDAVIYNGPVTIQQYLVNEEKVNKSCSWIVLLDSLKTENCFLCKSVRILAGITFLLLVISLCYRLMLSSTSYAIGDKSDRDYNLTIIDRKKWHERIPNYTNTLPLELPVTKVIIIHTVTESCYNLETCGFQVRSIQNFHMDVHKWDDIGYNFLIGGDGRVYEGCGWKIEGAHTYHFNKRSIGIAFIGNFNSVLPPQKSLIALKLLLKQGVQEKYIRKDYKLFGHRQLISIESPGEALYKEIQTWPHWTSNVYGD